MTYYPYSRKLKEAAGSENNFSRFQNGNFGLWYNKFVPLKSVQSPKASNMRGEDTKAVDLYRSQFGKMKSGASEFLEKKQVNQLRFCESMEQLNMKTLVFHAKLTSPLVTGIGESHPHKISMVFDHTTGIPYISASGIKGVARLAYILDQVLEEKDGTKVVKAEFSGSDEINEKDVEGLFSHFGSQDNRGGITFLDAYPVTVPGLKADIMTPHYSDYYSDDDNQIPPADNRNPKPIKFLTIPAGTEFVFRVVIDENKIDVKNHEANATRQRHVATIVGAALKEGIGAKTALGYGRFEVVGEKEPDQFREKAEELKLADMSEEEKQKVQAEKELANMLASAGNISNQGDFDAFYDRWRKNEQLKDNEDIARKINETVFEKKVVKKKKAKGNYRKKYKTVAGILGIDLDE